MLGHDAPLNGDEPAEPILFKMGCGDEIDFSAYQAQRHKELHLSNQKAWFWYMIREMLQQSMEESEESGIKTIWLHFTHVSPQVIKIEYSQEGFGIEWEEFNTLMAKYGGTNKDFSRNVGGNGVGLKDVFTFSLPETKEGKTSWAMWGNTGADWKVQGPAKREKTILPYPPYYEYHEEPLSVDKNDDKNEVKRFHFTILMDLKIFTEGQYTSGTFYEGEADDAKVLEFMITCAKILIEFSVTRPGVTYFVNSEQITSVMKLSSPLKIPQAGKSRGTCSYSKEKGMYQNFELHDISDIAKKAGRFEWFIQNEIGILLQDRGILQSKKDNQICKRGKEGKNILFLVNITSQRKSFTTNRESLEWYLESTIHEVIAALLDPDKMRHLEQLNKPPPDPVLVGSENNVCAYNYTYDIIQKECSRPNIKKTLVEPKTSIRFNITKKRKQEMNKDCSFGFKIEPNLMTLEHKRRKLGDNGEISFFSECKKIKTYGDMTSSQQKLLWMWNFLLSWCKSCMKDTSRIKSYAIAVMGNDTKKDDDDDHVHTLASCLSGRVLTLKINLEATENLPPQCGKVCEFVAWGYKLLVLALHELTHACGSDNHDYRFVDKNYELTQQILMHPYTDEYIRWGTSWIIRNWAQIQPKKPQSLKRKRNE